MSAHLFRYGSIAVLLLSIHSVIFSATSISFINAPATIDQVQEFEVDATLICTGCTSDSYIRGVFYPSGTSYFGYTQNNVGVWINAPGGSCTEYFKIASSDLKEGSWSGKLKVKPDIESSYYASPGEYLFKIGRYTGSCSATWSSEKTIAITGPTATPTSTPTPTNVPSSTPTNTPVPASNTVSPTVKPSITPTSMATPTIEVISTVAASPTGVVLGDQDPPTSNNKPYIIALLFFSIGCALLAAVVVVRNNLYLKK